MKFELYSIRRSGTVSGVVLPTMILYNIHQRIKFIIKFKKGALPFEPMCNTIDRQKIEAKTWIQRFTGYLMAKNKEESTIKLYVAEITHFINWLSQTGKSIHSVLQEDILASRDELYLQGKKLSTINKYVSILTTFFSWAKEAGYVTHNPAADTRIFTPRKKGPPRWLSAEEVSRLLELAAGEKNPLKRARNEALLHVLLFAGLRVEEVSELKVESHQGDELVVFDKSAELRRVPIPEATSEKLTEWIARRTFFNKRQSDRSFLFVTERSDCMKPRAIQFVLKKYSEKLGFTVNCHDLRNTFCRRLAVQGTPIQLLKRWAGHKSFLTSYQYYAELQ
jgi:site-specific recombinase XerD